MKRVIFVIFSVFFSLSVFSQKLNPDGKKMVSSVTVLDYNSNGKVTEQSKVNYEYDNNGWLKTVRVVTGTDKITVSKNGHELQSNVYKYVLNEYGYIILKELKYSINNDLVKKWTKYYYDVDCDEMFLRQISRQQFVKDGNKWSPSHDIFYLNFAYFDGDCYWEKAHSSDFNIQNKREFYGRDVKYRDGKYSNIVNDLNINPNLFLSMLCWEICLDIHEFELSTEWCGMVSGHILEYENGFKIETVINDNGNITEMLTRDKNGNIFCKIIIKYLY